MKMMSVRSPHVKDAPAGAWTNAKLFGNQFFVSGMTAHDGNGEVEGDGSMYDQARRTFQKIKHLVNAAGAAMDDVIEMTIYVTDITQRKEVWRARQEFFTGDFPCSTLVEVRALAAPPVRVEISVCGFIGASQA
jgi:2-iminobutanoate/2-iminopropanoate deaminase